MPIDNFKKKLCKQPATIPRIFDPGVSSLRMGYILSSGLKWVNGTEIKFMFLEGTEPQKNVVRRAFQVWKALGIGISFKEVATVDDAMVRIGFDQRDGSWSYVGRDILTVPRTERTMNFGWDLTANSYGMTTAIHEIGHTIGFQHEHQSPYAGIEWNTPAVYAEFSGPPNNWPKDQIDANILSKLPANQVKGSAWDPKSIMEYEFGPGLVLQPSAYRNGIFPPGILSANDIKGVKTFYPVVSSKTTVKLKLNKSAVIKASSGGQDDYIFTAPFTKKYTFQTVGQLDTVMVISEKAKTENYYLSGDDDSGLDKNSKITLPLVKGRDYLINLRVMFTAGEECGSVIVS
ncbi:MAG TPA: M12 family metallopeptidase [Prolixibacteraceae bacterium]